MTNWLRKLVLSFLLPRPLRRVASEIIAGLDDGSLKPDPPLGGYRPKGSGVKNPKPPRGGSAVRKPCPIHPTYTLADMFHCDYCGEPDFDEYGNVIDVSRFYSNVKPREG